MEHNTNMESRVEENVKHYVTKGVKIAFFIIFGILIAFLVVYILMRLWNWLLPDLFGVPMITYWQAFGILVLAKIIFGFGGGGSSKSSSKSKSKRRFRSDKRCGPLRRDFSEWKLYDEFWATEGEAAYQDFVKRKSDENEEAQANDG